MLRFSLIRTLSIAVTAMLVGTVTFVLARGQGGPAGDQDQPVALEAEFVRDSVTTDSYNGRYVLTNSSTHAVNDWTIELQLPESVTIVDYWGAELTRQGQRFIFTNPDPDQTVEPGGAVSFGFAVQVGPSRRLGLQRAGVAATEDAQQDRIGAVPSLPPGNKGEIVSVGAAVVAPDPAVRRCLHSFAVGGTEKGSSIVVNECDGSVAQQWTVADDGSLQVKGGCATVGPLEGGSANVLYEECQELPSQVWKVRSDGTLHHPDLDMCLTDPLPTWPSSWMSVTPCDGRLNQQFQVF